MWNDYINEKLDRIETIKRCIEIIKLNIENKINEIENIGINLNNLRIKLNNIYNEYNNKIDTDNINILKNVVVAYREELEQFYTNLNKYDYFKELHEQFEMYKRNLPEILNMTSLNKTLNNYIEDIIIDLETLKEKDEFMNENYTSFIYNIYKISYEFMKYEIIYNDESKLFNYFTSNEHDFWYINEFVKMSIEGIESSINYIFNYDKLKLALESKENSNHYMYKNIIKEISICENPNSYKNKCYLEFEKFYNKFSSIHQKFAISFCWYGIMSKDPMTKKKFKTLKLEYLTLKKEYEKFISNKEFLKEYKEEELENVNNFCKRAEISLTNYFKN